MIDSRLHTVAEYVLYDKMPPTGLYAYNITASIITGITIPASSVYAITSSGWSGGYGPSQIKYKELYDMGLVSRDALLNIMGMK